MLLLKALLFYSLVFIFSVFSVSFWRCLICWCAVTGYAAIDALNYVSSFNSISTITYFAVSYFSDITDLMI